VLSFDGPRGLYLRDAGAVRRSGKAKHYKTSALCPDRRGNRRTAPEGAVGEEYILLPDRTRLPPMGTAGDRRLIITRGVVTATAGLLLALGIVCGLGHAGLSPVAPRGCVLALAATVAVQGTLVLVVRRGWSGVRGRDRHFVYVPMVAATFVLSLYIYVAPAMRALLLMAWPAAPIFLAGLVGFAGVVSLAALMALSYLGVMVLLARQGYPVALTFEAAMGGVFVLINAYSGVVLEQLRLQREERKALRARLAELAITDPLTGLYNRRHCEEILRSELARIRRYGGCCSVAMIDLDFFKAYNDSLGHLAGDALLRELAALLREHLRVSDVLARYGGEEFVLVMVNTPKADAIRVMERLRALVEQYPFRAGRAQPLGRLTVSVGIASCPDDGWEYEDLMRVADEALYAAKRLGRNQVRSASA
jgi:diguanylate cyclase (GGDEF)-like protein